MPLFEPVMRFVSASISARIWSKLVYFLPFWCRNSPHSPLRSIVTVAEISCYVIYLLCIHQLQNQWPPRHNARATGQEVASNEVLQDGRLARALAADDGDLGQINRDWQPTCGARILEFINQRNQRLHFGIAGNAWHFFSCWGWWSLWNLSNS